MFSKEKKDFGLIFEFKTERAVSLHMFFVFYPIDVLFLDSNNKVISMKENFKPFTTFNPRKKIKYVVELPNNTISNSNTIINDLIEF